MESGLNIQIKMSAVLSQSLRILGGNLTILACYLFCQKIIIHPRGLWLPHSMTEWLIAMTKRLLKGNIKFTVQLSSSPVTFGNFLVF